MAVCGCGVDHEEQVRENSETYAAMFNAAKTLKDLDHAKAIPSIVTQFVTVEVEEIRKRVFDLKLKDTGDYQLASFCWAAISMELGFGMGVMLAHKFPEFLESVGGPVEVSSDELAEFQNALEEQIKHEESRASDKHVDAIMKLLRDAGVNMDDVKTLPLSGISGAEEIRPPGNYL